MPEESRVLVLFAHPALQKSRINRVLAAEVRDLPGVTFHDLYEEYPELDIDVKREQQLLDAHDVVLLQFPFYWYSTPAILKEWQDLVLEHGWAYGSAGNALQGKVMLVAVSTGGREDTYQNDGFNRFTIRELLAPLDATAFLCGMEFLPPFVVHGTHKISPEQIASSAAEYRRLVEALRDGRLDLESARRAHRLNADLDSLITRDPQD